ncbi:MAG: VWA domain-containing protein [Candidatus Sungiibacteriota bacterium]|uniref:VWA domain-containing protein n=1 Tax=Candidatus Sungiibacteriota bacterium TaxID=2750080 RepID=A0A7T5RJ02_9BACT|nr:MAG: VWA domain-containing protein [Candidatus Sungbacteria bacterium]
MFSGLELFFSRYFETPEVLLLILLLVLSLIVSRRSRVSVSSRTLFQLLPRSCFTRALFLLGPLFLFLGTSSGIVALAKPRSAIVERINREVSGQIAILIDDISGSMGMQAKSGKSRLEVLKVANEIFLNEFCREKIKGEGLGLNMAGLVVFDSDAQVLVRPTTDCNLVRRAVRSLKDTTSTSVEQGLWAGLKLLLIFADKERIIPLTELTEIQTSLKERAVRIPQRRQEFCEKNQGLSLLLFTDGDFAIAGSRQALLQERETTRGGYFKINPFHVLDLAKALCIKTYFWSMNEIWPAFEEAFSNPPGTGEAMLVSDLDERTLGDLYRRVAEKERGGFVIQEVTTYNPLRRYFIAGALVGILCGAFLTGLGRLLVHSGRARK